MSCGSNLIKIALCSLARFRTASRALSAGFWVEGVVEFVLGMVGVVVGVVVKVVGLFSEGR